MLHESRRASEASPMSLSSQPPSQQQRQMQWLSRSATTAAAPSKPVHRPMRSIDVVSPRVGVLGAGATVVRTPDEALRETGVRRNYDAKSPRPKVSVPTAKPSTATLNRTSSTSSTSTRVGELTSPPTSPPLPPLPLSEADDEEYSRSMSMSSPYEMESRTIRTGRTPPPSPIRGPTRSSLKSRSTSSLISDDIPTVPQIPAHIAAVTQPPLFSAILVSDPPTILEPHKTIVTLETCTETYKTTLQTLNSRHSHLTKFIHSLANSTRSTASSVYSTQSDDMAAYRQHLSSQGLLPQSGSVHLFLDRPSAPYAHILNYLRTPVMPGSSDCLPRSLRLAGSPNTASTLDALIDVREEAAFLGLDSLYRLCSDEIRQRYSPKQMHARGNSSSNVNVHNSTHSLHTLVERAETPLNNTLSSSSTGSTSSAPVKPKPQRMNTDPKGPVPVPAVVPEQHISLHKKANASVSSLAALTSPPPGWI